MNEITQCLNIIDKPLCKEILHSRNITRVKTTNDQLTTKAKMGMMERNIFQVMIKLKKILFC